MDVEKVSFIVISKIFKKQNMGINFSKICKISAMRHVNYN